MAYPQGINFRATAGFVTDGAGDASEIGTTANYPRSTPQGNVVGWEQAPTGTRDRAVAPAQVAGIHYLTSSSGVFANYRFDLPAAGEYDVYVAAGDVSNPAFCKLELFDNATSKGVLVNRIGTEIPLGAFVDATGVLRADYNDWITNNAPLRVTFASTIARFRLGSGLGANESIAHIRLVAVGGGTSPVSSDLAASYAIAGRVSKDLAASYSILAAGQVSSDLSAAYGIRSAVSKDLAASYAVAAPAYTFTSDQMVPNTDTPAYGTETAHYTLWTGGRVGALGGLTPVEGAKALVGGKLVLTGLAAGTYRVEGAVRGASANVDAEFVQHFTVG